MNIDLTKRADREIKKLNEPYKSRVMDAIYKLPEGDVAAIKGCKGLFRRRVGGLRIVFSFAQTDTILVEKVETRGRVYKGGVTR